MRHALARVLLLALLAAAAPARAQPPAEAPGLTAGQAASVLDVLRDERRRAEFIATLEALAQTVPPRPPAAPAKALQGPAAAPAGAAQPEPAAPAPAPAPPPAVEAALAPDSLGAQLVAQVSAALSRASEQVASSVRAVNDLPLLRRWVASQAADPEARARILGVAWKLAVVVGAALAAEWAARRGLRRARAGLARWASNDAAPGSDPASPGPAESGLAAAEAGETERSAQRHRLSLAWRTMRRLPAVLAALVLDLVPVALFALAGYLLLATDLGEPAAARAVITVVLGAYLLCVGALCVADMLVGPGEPGLRLLHVSEWTAAFVTKWVRRIAVAAAVGTALAEVGLQFGMYRSAYAALLKLTMLVVHLFLVTAVLQGRGAVQAYLRAPPGAKGTLATLRNRAAEIWHLVAIFYIAALWIVWAAELRDGYSRLLTFFLVTSAVLVGARLLAILLFGGLDRALRISPELSARLPGLEDRANLYYPVLRAVLGGLLAAVSGVALLMLWGFDPLSWFADGQLGRRAVSAMILIGITTVSAVAVWKGANALIERHLARLTEDMQLTRAGRLRTLLPMLRASLLVTISLVVLLTVLSELGVNIAPLLAGAGVVGIAVGFGSQKLVQDLITGLFLLLENAMQVGDVVTLGGLTGTVEALSIRTIRLRSLDGSVHIIPFSAVTTVTNQTRDYAYAVLDVSVGLDEAPERIGGLLRDIARAMRAEPSWRMVLSDELDVMGVERLGDTAWVMRARIKTLPASRWAVTRELNERIKHCFDELAIESPFTSRRALGEHAAAAMPVVAGAAAAAGTTVADAGSPAR